MKSYVSLCGLFLVVSGAERSDSVCKDQFTEVSKIVPLTASVEFEECLNDAKFDMMENDMKEISEETNRAICLSKNCHSLKKKIDKANLQNCVIEVFDRKINIPYEVNALFEKCPSLDLSKPTNLPEPPSAFVDKNETAKMDKPKIDTSSSQKVTKDGLPLCDADLSKDVLTLTLSEDYLLCKDDTEFDMVTYNGTESIANNSLLCDNKSCKAFFKSLNDTMASSAECAVTLDEKAVNVKKIWQDRDDKCKADSKINPVATESKPIAERTKSNEAVSDDKAESTVPVSEKKYNGASVNTFSFITAIIAGFAMWAF